jgi:hypothetical protein
MAMGPAARMTFTNRNPKTLSWRLTLALPQIRILYFLIRGPKRITDVSQTHGMALPNASNMVEWLVKKG